MIFDVNHSLIEHLRSSLDVEYFDSITSTNDFAKENIKTVIKPKAILTSMQTQGRGRGDNDWFQRKTGEQLNLSLCFPLEKPAQYFTSALSGLCLSKALFDVYPDINFSLKAPNDLYIGLHKVGGILTESISMGTKNWLIIGVGFNVFSSPFEFTTDLSTELRKKDQSFDAQIWKDIVLKFIQNILETLPQMCQEKISDENRKNLLDHYKKNSHHSELIDVSPDASLVCIGGTISWTDQ